MPKIEIYNVGSIGVNKDKAPHYLPPEAWTDSNNMVFREGVATKRKGHTAIFGTPSVAPGFLLNLPVATTSYWIYTSLTKAYVYESGTHSNITRQSASVDVDYTAVNYRDWNGGVLGGIPILNNGADLPQYWGAISSATKLANLTNWPSTMRAKIVRPFGPFLVALNINDNSTLYPHMFWWSHPADPGQLPSSWDYSDPAYDAGRKELTDAEGGQIIDALQLRDLLIIYKETSTHYMRFVGGQEIMANDLLFTGGIKAPRCVVPIMKGQKHFVATLDDIITHNGQTVDSVLSRKARQYLQNDIDLNNYRNSFCVNNSAQEEAWFCYPSAGATFPNKVFVWNYDENTIQFRDFVGIHALGGTAVESTGTAWDSLTDTWNSSTANWSDEGQRQLLIADPTNTLIYKADSTEGFNGAGMTSFLERTGLAYVGKDRNGAPKADFTSFKLFKRIWPKITGDATVNIRVGSQETHEGAITWSSPQEFIPGTQKYLDFTVPGRLHAVRFEASGTASWQLEGYDIEIEVLSEQ